MTSKFTREQLIKKAQEQIAFCRHTKITGEGLAHVNQCAALFEIALAAMGGEPRLHIKDQQAQVTEREPIAWLNDAYLARGVVDGEAGSEDAGPGYIPVYREAGPQPAPVVPEKCPAEIRDLIASHSDALFNDDDAQEIWNAWRATMLQASPVCTCPSGDGSLRWPCPVHPGNSPAIPDSARDALEKALAAMEFMGDTLNNLDAVCTEDVELVAPAFDAVRSVLAAAKQEVKGE
ncbi:Uncharacterised protein [Klebsiella quasipneumoniae]|uniref:hypothetical protein n=1 Tax=Klebsiella quasipneumoniae TaxID=1463165 RepID=UPI000E2D0671|nr:hypothetical protein [Klebsiella quasipneumoniae]SXD23796.1 Uncharacterised protein [Klebsiella quasipneumoniae]